MDALVLQGLDINLKQENPEDMTKQEWLKTNRLAYGSIRLCLAKDAKYFVMRENMTKLLWKKLEDKLHDEEY